MLHGSAPRPRRRMSRWAGTGRATNARLERTGSRGSGSSPLGRPIPTEAAREPEVAVSPCPGSPEPRCSDGSLQITPQPVIGAISGIASGSEEPRATRQRVRRFSVGVGRRELEAADCGAQAPGHPISRDGVPHRTSDGVRDSRRRVTGKPDGGHATSGRSTTGSVEVPEGAAVTNAPNQADNRCRPLRRRDRITARPPRDDIRLRKPCRLDRFRTLG